MPKAAAPVPLLLCDDVYEGRTQGQLQQKLDAKRTSFDNPVMGLSNSVCTDQMVLPEDRFS